MDPLEEAMGLSPEPCESKKSCPRKVAKPAVKKASAPVASSDYQLKMPSLLKPLSFNYEGGNPMATEKTDTPDVDKLGKNDYLDIGKTGLGALAGLFTALGIGDDAERSKYDLPGAGGADMPALGGVDKPFQGRMDMSPEQRQSLALTLLR